MPVVKSTVVKGSVNAAKSNGTAKSASKPADGEQAGTGSKPDASGTATAKAPAAKASPAKSAANGASRLPSAR